jgi:signal transduction histidine kinase
MLRHTSIKKRLTLLITAISGSAVLLTTIAITLIGIYNLRVNLTVELEETARNVGERNQASIAFDRIDEANQNLHQVFSIRPSILRACMYELNGKPAAMYVSEAISDKTCPAIQGMQEGVSYPDGITRVSRQLKNSSGFPTAYIVVDSDMREIAIYVRKQIFTALLVSIGMSALAYLLALNLQRTISKPILDLSETARRISAERDYSLRAEYSASAARDNEIVTFIDSFNTMLEEIQLRDQQLLRKNEELGKAKEVAETASRAKSHFLANISHELRTPLNAIIGFSSILINQLFGALGHEKYMEYAHDINDAGVHLLDIINDILDLSKAEAGKLVLVFEEVHIERAINKCITILSERAAEGQVTITTDIPKGLPYIIADRLRFIQIVLNILSNAVKFTASGGNVHITVRPQMRGGMVTDFMITIKDTGIGITQENIHKVFQSFGQIDSGLNRRYEGTGLGLPLTKKLVDLHHGNITLESEPGVGTTVILHFIANPTYINDLLDTNTA